MMPAYNAGAFIGPAIESIQTQTYTRWELIVVNDGSTDRTPEILAGISDERIRVFHQENAGEAAARNRALQEIHGEFLAFLDSDDEYEPNFLARMVETLRPRPDLDGVYSDGVYVDPAGRSLAALSDHRRGPFAGDLFEALVRASDVFGPPICLLLRSRMVRASGLNFDTRIVIGPDWDFTTRLAETARFGYLAEKLVRYRVHTTNITVTAGNQKRRDSLALCREKAINLIRFTECSIETRAYVFYDLLINLLVGNPSRQEEVTHWPQFQQLPVLEQARLYRLLASQTIRDQEYSAQTRAWLEQARQTNPRDPKNLVLYWAYRISPRLCSLLLQVRQKSLPDSRDITPFNIDEK